MKRLAKLNEIYANPNNPRVIKDDKFKKLVESLKVFPKMLEKRPIVVDENMVILGGNMRFRAAKDAGYKEVWIDIADDWTEEEKAQFVIKDNTSSGEWDWDILANNWPQDLLDKWGIKVDQWKPTLNPDSVFNQITNKDIEDMQNKLNHAHDNKPAQEIEVICPYCAKEFAING